MTQTDPNQREAFDIEAVSPGGPGRLNVLKTYKLYIGGKFPRTESGRYYKVTSADNRVLANVCQASRKDFRNAVVAARAAQAGWAKASAYLRGQIVYRIAEMLEGRTSQFVSELIQQGADPSEAQAEVAATVDRLVYYAGWADKYQQVFSSVNPVASSHFNFSILEPTGVVAVLAPDLPGVGKGASLLGLISTMIPAIAGGNSVVALASTAKPLCAISFAEVLHTSDLPGGVVNLLTGERGELASHFASHMDVNALIYCGEHGDTLAKLRVDAATNIKRVIHLDRTDWLDAKAQSPYAILDTQEVKTTWHPIGQ